MRALEACREDWHDHQRQQAMAAEHDTHGNLIRHDRARDFRRTFGTGTGAMFRYFRQPWATRRRYATPELLEWWAYHGQTTFEQWALGHGFRRKFLLAARRRGRA